MDGVKVDGIAGLVTVDRAAKMLRMSPDGVHKIVKRNNVPYVRLGKSLLLRPSDLALYRDIPDLRNGTERGE